MTWAVKDRVKYQPEELYTQWAHFRAKSKNKESSSYNT
jgi:hypothetical protein